MAGAIIATDSRNGERETASAATRNGETRRENVREQILEAARFALIRDGYEKITTRRIADAAGINVATLHYHFRTKEALLSEVIAYVMERAEERLRTAIAPAATATEALERAFQEVWKIVLERPGVLRYDVAVRALRDTEARKEANAIYGLLRRMVEEILERHCASGGTLAEGTTAPELAFYIVGAVDGIVLQHTLTGDDDSTKRSLELVRQHSLTLMGCDATQGGQETLGQ
jgi:AcrR family transcriptional regulator